MQGKVQFVVPIVVPINIFLLSLCQQFTKVTIYVYSKNNSKKREG